MSKNKILTDIDIANYSLKRGLTNILSDYAKEKSLEKKASEYLIGGMGVDVRFTYCVRVATMPMV